MEDIQKIKNVIEALLIVSESGLSREELKNVVGADQKEIDEAVELLKADYGSLSRAFTVAEIAGKCRFVTRPEYMFWINNLYQPEPERLSRPALETLAIIAYKQPLTRAEMEGIRGVDVEGVVKTLLGKELITIRGRKDAPGRPLLYGTGEKFLELFGLNSLGDLPLLREFTEEDLEYAKPYEGQFVENVGHREPASDLANADEQKGEPDKNEAEKTQ